MVVRLVLVVWAALWFDGCRVRVVAGTGFRPCWCFR